MIAAISEHPGFSVSADFTPIFLFIARFQKLPINLLQISSFSVVDNTGHGLRSPDNRP